MSEKNAHTWLKANVFRSPNRLDRVENLLGAGMPDTNGCVVHGYEFWLEIKSPTEPKRSATPLFGSNHKVSQQQANWFLSQRNAGGRAMFWIETDKRRMLVPGVYADFLNEMTVDKLLDVSLWSQLKGTKINPEEILQCFRR